MEDPSCRSRCREYGEDIPHLYETQRVLTSSYNPVIRVHPQKIQSCIDGKEEHQLDATITVY
jgi:hypothetical protein